MFISAGSPIWSRAEIWLQARRIEATERATCARTISHVFRAQFRTALNPPQKPRRLPARELGVEEPSAGQRLDNFLLRSLKGVPRSHVYRLIRSGQVRVNSGRVKPDYRLEPGDKVRVPPVAAKPPPDGAARTGGLDWLERRILLEDERLIVLDKPAGLAVHGGSGVRMGCIEALRALRPDARELELAHRLDRETSGVLLIAKRRSALRTLHALLRAGAVEKRYLTLLKGRWRRGSVEIEAPLLKRGGGEGEARVSVDPAGKHARSSFELREVFGARASLLEIEIATGRTHQIRVHATHLGHPVAGDERYGDRAFNERMHALGLRRMFLHARSLRFAWPDSGERFAIEAPLPPELEAVLTALRADRGRPA
jgi:23S rRNA pseudouridine955/2504/2580 synthase